MSHISNRPLTEDELDIIESLLSLPISGASQGISKVGSTSFDNTTFSGGGGGAGTVTSVAMSVPAGLTVSGSPIITAGTFALGLDTGYVIPLQTTLDSYALKSGALTQFVGNNNWKVFYSDGSGDVQELALGADGTFLKSNGAAVAPSFATPAGSGDVSKVGTPVDNQIGIWTGDGTIEGDTALTFDTTTDTLGSVDLSLSNDLFFGSGGIVNYDNSDYTVTHSAGLLTFSGDITFGNSLTTTGDLDAQAGGAMTFSALTTSGPDIEGKDVQFYGGAGGTGDTAGGNVLFRTGSKSGAGTIGYVKLQSGDSGSGVNFNLASLTEDRIITWQDVAGTVALTSDLTGVESLAIAFAVAL